MKNKNKIPNRNKLNKKAQFSMQFNWLFVLIAGGIILILFLTFGFRFQSSSDTRANIQLLNKVDNIFNSIVSTNRLATSINIPKSKIDFICDEDSYSGYRLVDGEAFKETNFIPLFAPRTVETESLNIWSMEFKYPFKIMNTLFVTSPNVQYIFIDGRTSFSTQFISDFRETMKQFDQDSFKVVRLEQGSCEIKNIKNNEHVRLVFLDTSPTNNCLRILPNILKDADDLSAISIHERSNSEDDYNDGYLIYYKKDSNKLIPVETSNNIPSVNLPNAIPYLTSVTDEPNPILYGAIFSDNKESFLCNMQKIYSRMLLILNLSLDRFNSFYSEDDDKCRPSINEFLKNVEDKKTILELCAKDAGSDVCIKSTEEIVSMMNKLKESNEVLQKEGGCISFY